MIEGQSGMTGVVDGLPAIYTKCVLVPPHTKYSCKISFAANETMYSTVKHVSVLEGTRRRVLLTGRDVPFMTGQISI